MQNCHKNRKKTKTRPIRLRWSTGGSDAICVFSETGRPLAQGGGLPYVQEKLEPQHLRFFEITRAPPRYGSSSADAARPSYNCPNSKSQANHFGAHPNRSSGATRTAIRGHVRPGTHFGCCWTNLETLGIPCSIESRRIHLLIISLNFGKWECLILTSGFLYHF